MKQVYRIFLFLLFTSLLSATYASAKSSIFDTSASGLFSTDDEFLKVDQAFVFDFFQQKIKSMSAST